MGGKKKKKKSSAEWFRPVLPVKKAQEKKIWRGECSNVPKKSKSGVVKKKKLRTVRLRRKHVPHHVDHQQNIFKIGNPSGEPDLSQKKKKKKTPFRGSNISFPKLRHQTDKGGAQGGYTHPVAPFSCVYTTKQK